jgi:DNA polymerase I-like protein with 3'-5' exonuclease and polymerase domains
MEYKFNYNDPLDVDGDIYPVVLDLETSVDAPKPHFRATPFHKDNQVVLWGNTNSNLDIETNTTRTVLVEALDKSLIEGKKPTIVGHNVSFDYHYVLRDFDVSPSHVLRHTNLWDTQLAEFVLSKQQSKDNSLDSIAEKYGGYLKDDRIKAMWDSGMRTEDIPSYMLEEYLKGDVTNTALVAAGQFKQVCAEGKMPLMKALMAARKATSEMEFNGMCVDVECIKKLTSEYQIKLDTIEKSIATTLKHIHGIDESVGININSGSQLSALLFGGEFKSEPYRKLVGKYKNGKDKYLKGRDEIRLGGMSAIIPDGAKVTKSGHYSVNEETLLKAAAKARSGDLKGMGKLIDDILEYRKLYKHVNTYFANYLELQIEGIIHHSINHTRTVTGRLSSSKPNFQNVTSVATSPLKSVFVSRFGDEGYILELDYKQLEVICLAHLSQDPQLIEDIRDGVDLHAKTGEKVFGKTMTNDERRIVKGVNFGLIYGGTAYGLSRSMGQPEKLVASLIESFYNRYPGVQKWQHEVAYDVERNKFLPDKPDLDKLGKPMYHSTYRLPTGREFLFKQKDSQHPRGKPKFSPTEMKNYPVQGLATGDIMTMMLGILLEELLDDNDDGDYEFKINYGTDCFLINTVHDSILLDVHQAVLGSVACRARRVLEEAPHFIKQHYGFEFNLPLKVDVTAGRNWKEQENIDDLVDKLVL